MSFSKTLSAAPLKLLLEQAQQQGLDRSIVHRLRVLVYFTEHLYSISATCRFFGISRSTFYRWIEHFDPKDLSTLQDRSAPAFASQKSIVSVETVELIRRYRMRYVQIGKERISELFASDHNIVLSPSTIGRVIERECLYFDNTPFHWKKRQSLKEQDIRHETPSQDESITAPSRRESLGEPLSSEPLEIVRQPDASQENRAVTLPQSRRFEFWRFLMVASVLSNIVFASALVGIAVFESSVSKTNAASDTHEFEETAVLHTAPDTVPLP